jgi:hypothetical protein
LNVKTGDLALCIMESSSHLSEGGESRLSFPNMWINSAKSMCMDALNSMPWCDKSITELGSNSAGKGYRCLEFGNCSSADQGWTDQALPCPSIAPQTEATFDGGGGLDQVSGWPFKFTQALVGGGAWMSGYPSFPFLANAVHKMNIPAGFTPYPSATMADEYMGLQQPVLPANWLVEDYVCRQTEPLRYCRAGNPTERSAYRRAADTLAKSNLNPNAEVFTPKKAALVMAASEKAEEDSGTDPLPVRSSGVAESVVLPEEPAQQQEAAEEPDGCGASIAVEFSSSPRPLLDRR